MPMELLFHAYGTKQFIYLLIVFDIIYQTNLPAIDGNTSYRISRIGPVLDGLHRIAIHNLIVFHTHDRIGVYRIDYIVDHLLHTLFGRKVSTFF